MQKLSAARVRPDYLHKLTPFLKRPAVKALGQTRFLFLLLAIPAIVIFIHIVPPGWGLDEQEHVARAYQISEGDFYPDKLPGADRFGGPLPAPLTALLDYGHTESNTVDRSAPYYDRHDLRNRQYLATLEAAPLKHSASVEYEFGASGPYSPVVYLPAATGMFLGRHMGMSVNGVIVFAKVLQAGMYVLFCFLALWVLRNRGVRWVFFIIALLSSSIYLSTTINADAYTVSVVLLFGAAVFELIARRRAIAGQQIALLLVLTGLLACAKPSYAILVLALLAAPKAYGAGRRRVYILLSILGVTAVVGGITSLKALPYAAANLLYKDPLTAAHISLAGQLKWIIIHPLQFLEVLINAFIINGGAWTQSLIGELGYNTVDTPYLLVLLILGLLGIAALYKNDLGKKVSAYILGVGAVSALAVIVILYATFNAVGATAITGVQGRYFIPCLAFIAVGLAGILPVTVHIKTERAAACLFALGSLVVLYATVFEYMAVLS